ncbi:MAG: hypothetical protein J6A05_09865 [Oscillospiraceae bacterium]|nr:hypothetical protein [Clostridia bacterium]MBP1550296.1 hypothetical protein [Oscillospiraceae bacterium]
MSLKLSYRDKVIFIVVMVILVLVGGFFLLIKPKFQDVERAQRNLETKQQEKMDIDAKISTLPGLIQSMKDAATSIKEKQEIFLPEGMPYENENYVREFLNELNIEINSMSTNYTTAGGISRYVVNNNFIFTYDNKMNADIYKELPEEVYNKYNGVKREAYPAATIGVTNMTVTFSSPVNSQDVYEVIDRIADDEKTIILNTVSTEVVTAGESEKVESSVNLTLYSIYPLNVEKVLEETDEVKPLETQPAA